MARKKKEELKASEVVAEDKLKKSQKAIKEKASATVKPMETPGLATPTQPTPQPTELKPVEPQPIVEPQPKPIELKGAEVVADKPAVKEPEPFTPSTQYGTLGDIAVPAIKSQVTPNPKIDNVRGSIKETMPKPAGVIKTNDQIAAESPDAHTAEIKTIANMIGDLKKTQDEAKAKDKEMQKKESSRQMIAGLGDTLSALSNLFTVGEAYGENINITSQANKLREIADKARGERATKLKDIANRLDLLKKDMSRVKGQRAAAQKDEQRFAEQKRQFDEKMAFEREEMEQRAKDYQANRESQEKVAGIRASASKAKGTGTDSSVVPPKDTKGQIEVLHTDVGSGKQTKVSVNEKSYNDLVSRMFATIVKELGMEDDVRVKYEDDPKKKASFVKDHAHESPSFNDALLLLIKNGGNVDEVVGAINTPSATEEKPIWTPSYQPTRDNAPTPLMPKEAKNDRAKKLASFLG